jgi:hypothetical protein
MNGMVVVFVHYRSSIQWHFFHDHDFILFVHRCFGCHRYLLGCVTPLLAQCFSALLLLGEREKDQLGAVPWRTVRMLLEAADRRERRRKLVCLSASLLVCLPVCPPHCLSVSVFSPPPCLSVCQPTWLPTCPRACLSACQSACLSVLVFLSSPPPLWCNLTLSVCLSVCQPT